ncbi:MAG: SCP2 sterol-binding domain-containing protein [Pseudomonadota bacterium]
MVDADLLPVAQAFFPAPFDGVIRIEVLDADYAFWVDGRTSPPTVSPDSPDGVATRFCLWRIEYMDLNQLFAEGGQRLNNSFITGRLKISGDMGVMARLETGHE